MQLRVPTRLFAATVMTLVFTACADDTVSSPQYADIAAARGGAAAEAVRLMSRNLYLGGDIDHVLADPVGGSAIAWQEIQYTNYPERAARMAAEIIERQPHIVGLQEVTRYVVFDAGFSHVGGLDWLDILMAYLAPHGYRVVNRTQNFQAVLPLDGLYVQYTDGDAIIALSDVVVHEDGWAHFQAQVDLNDYVPGLGDNLRSYQWADVTVQGNRFLFVNTHLEVQGWAHIQVQQAAELIEFVNSRPMPTFMVGDFNSAANPNAPERAKTPTYDMILAAGFDDLWLRGNGRHTNSGVTCCQASDLANATSELDERLDIIFARNTPSLSGYAGGARLHVFGDTPSSRFVTSFGYSLWPSDHAGIFGEVWIPKGLAN